jgi:hypothetical protein
MTHRRYFQLSRLSVAQYGEILVAQALAGTKLGDAQPCYDVLVPWERFVDAIRTVHPEAASWPAPSTDARLQVRSKLNKTGSGVARVVQCKETDFKEMTHLIVVLVDAGARTEGGVMDDEGRIEHAWVISAESARRLRQKPGKVQYIAVRDLLKTPPAGAIEITPLLVRAAEVELEGAP